MRVRHIDSLGLHFGAGVRERHRIGKAREKAEGAPFPVNERLIACGRQLAVHGGWDPHLEGKTSHGAGKRCRRNTDDGVRKPADSQCCANSLWVGVKMAGPIGMPDDDQGVCVLLVINFLPRKESAYLRLELQQIEEVSGNGLAPNSFERVLISNGEIHWLGYRHFLREYAAVSEIAKSK